MIHVVLHPDRVLCGLAANPALPADLVDRLITLAATTPDRTLADDLAAELTDRDDLTPSQVRALFADVDDASRPESALTLLERGEGRPDLARRLAADPDPWLRGRLAACPDLPDDVVRRLAEDRDPEVVAELALAAPPDLAAALAHHPHTTVRRAVAANDRTPPDVVHALLTGDALLTGGTLPTGEALPPAGACPVCERHTVPYEHGQDCEFPDCPALPGTVCSGEHETGRHHITANALAHPATPPATAARFAGHPAAAPRAELAARTDLPPEVYRRLATDPVRWVRSALAENPAIDEDVIRILAEDESSDVARSLADHPRLPLDVLTRLAARGHAHATLLPRIAAASPTEVAQLAASPEPAVRMLVAERRDLPPAIRDALAADPDAKVLKAIAPHPGLPEPLLRAMLTRHGVRVAARMATNPDASPALLTDLAHHRPPVRTALRAIASHPAAPLPALTACLEDRQARPIAAANPSLPPTLLTELIADPVPHIAEVAAANPALPAPLARALLTQLTP
ncbi:hypothetical protein [Kitasatospora sp. NPDC057541]|uniref:hypothetical protein n=1 Tax=unclassified Kitasatospora TaxID=2633591 RepID=UPI00368C9F52